MQFLALVSDQVWGALIGAGIALLGVVLANRNFRKQLAMQLQHEAQQRDRDREMSLRREIFVDAAEAIARNALTFAKLLDLKSPDKEIGAELAADLARIQKVPLVGNDATIDSVLTYSRTLNSTFLAILVKRFPLVLRQIDIDIKHEYMERAGAERERYIELMKQANLEGGADPRRWKALQRGVKFEAKRFSELAEERDHLNRVQLREQMELTRELIERAISIGRLVPDTVIAIRRELEIPIDETRYRASVERSLDEMRRALSEMFPLVEAIAEEDDDKPAS